MSQNKRDKKEMDQVMDQVVNYDPLTRLFTYHRFQQEAQAIRKANPTGLFMLVYTNFRNFKYINDAFGYHVGDDILCQYADALRMLFERRLGRGGRVANDWFVSIWLVESREGWASQIDKLDQKFCDSIKAKYPGIKLSMQTGLYFMEPGDQISVAIDHANYARKMVCEDVLTGPKCVVFDRKLQERLDWEGQMINSLDKQIAAGEFKVYLQPKVRLHNNQIAGAEALVRWQQQGGDIAYPDEFIPFCEKNGLIGKIDYFVLQTTCQKIRSWMDAGIQPVCVSVNLSRYDCLEEGFLEKILEVTNRYQIPHQYIEFEITESVFVNDITSLNTFLFQLQKEGFEISMDDFGSGYSSLNILPDMPVGIIKLDREFWRQGKQNNNTKRNILLRKVIEMIRLMGFRIICEGIEKPEQVEFCKEIGCEMAQGYFFGKPMPLEDFDQCLLNSHRKSKLDENIHFKK